jgi:23S rRNA pseudouridine1911/1915/1917 synthase
MKFSGRVKRGKAAVTHWVVQRAFAKAALLEVRLETGRTHQIRVHLSEAGHPLLGDALYGGTAKGLPKVIDRQALHAWKLAFTHPRTGKALRFEAPLPPDFKAALAQL